MDIQQRHRDEAEALVREHDSIQPGKDELVEAIAEALARAENAAAWDGLEHGRDYERTDASYEKTAVLRTMYDKYGPEVKP